MTLMNPWLFSTVSALSANPLFAYLGNQNLFLITPELMILVILVFCLFKAVATQPRDQQDGWIYSLIGIVMAFLCLMIQSILMTMPGLSSSMLMVGNQTLLLDGFSWFSRLFLVMGTGLVILLSRDYIQSRSKSPAEFYVLILSALLGGMLLVSANDLVILFVALETLGISSYILSGYLRETPGSAEASLKYLTYGGVSSAVLLFGLSLLYGLSGGLTNLQDIAHVLQHPALGISFPILPILAVMIFGAFAFKLSLAPFHMWAPDIYEGAPTPVTAFLSVISKMSALMITIRVVLLLFPHNAALSAVFIALSVVSMIWGNVAALSQHNLKRLLAYSTVAQAGYILLGLVTLGSNAIAASVFYMVGYLFTNLGAFTAVTEIEQDLGTSDLSAIAGLVKKRPASVICLSVFLLSLAGIPVTIGFFTKFFLFQSVIQNQGGQLVWLIVVALLTSVISLYYYLNVIRLMVVQSPSDQVRYLKHAAINPIPSPSGFAITLCLFLTITLGLAASPMLGWIQSTLSPLASNSSNGLAMLGVNLHNVHPVR